jgi:hypothetical protein
LLLSQTSLLFYLTTLSILALAGLFSLTSLFLFLASLLPLLSLLRPLLILTLAIGLIGLAALLLGLAFVVSALLFSLASLLGFFVAPVFILILLRFSFFTAQTTIFPIIGFLSAGEPGGSHQSGQDEG